MTFSSTRERILDCAERLFSEKGISGTSLRALTRAADVNLAAVHYHFGSKEGLLDAVVERRAEPVNRERLAELADLERDGQPEVEAILRAFLAPGVRSVRAQPEMGERLTRLIARIEAQPPDVVEAIFRKHFGEIGKHFVEALQRALPDLPKEVVSDRFRFAAGCLSYLFSGNFDLDVIPNHPPHAQTDDDKIRDVILFIAAGLRGRAGPDRSHDEGPTQ